MATYTVKKGDTLSGIAQQNLSTIGASSIYGENGGVALLQKWNNISNPNYIVVGQVLHISNPGSDSGSGSTAPPANTTNKPTINLFGLQSNTDSTIFASWTWSRENTESYEVMWYYDTGDGVWFVGTKTTTEYTHSTYNAPSNAKQIKFKVKAISKTYRSNDTDVSYWTGDWSTEKIYDVSNNPPKKPDTPKVTLDRGKLTASLDNVSDLNADQIIFTVVKNDTLIVSSGTVKIQLTGHAEFVCNVASGASYKVCCRSKRGSLESENSDYSDSVFTNPTRPTMQEATGKSATSIYLEWSNDPTAKSYEIEYSNRIEAFDSADDTTTEGGILYNHYEKTGLETGKQYFFRVRSINDAGESPWSNIVSVTIGEPPTSPTTWSSSTVVSTGEKVVLYWVHNSGDGSKQFGATIQLDIGGVISDVVIDQEVTDKDKNKTQFYEIDTTQYTDGTQIKWKVKTRGVTGVYGDWSVERTIDVHAQPMTELAILNDKAESSTKIEVLPFYIQVDAYPKSQTPTGYHLSIIADESYETVDAYGNVKMVNEGDEVYAKQFSTSGSLLVIFSAENVTLENNIKYIVRCVTSFDSGLTCDVEGYFKVAWSDDIYIPNAKIGIDKNSLTANINPYIQDADGNLIEGMLLSVYRREFDGSFVEIIKDVPNKSDLFVTDPHPALDLARYRIVAKSETTGTVSYTDLPGVPVGEKGIVIQWDEKWSSYDAPEATAMEQPNWTGSMLKLMYNVDISDKNKPDVELIEYIGRSHPTSYYGTHIGSTSSWSVVIPADDKETLYQIRRLANYMGDVYVREPSGSGYWANVTVSFSKKHHTLTIPISFEVTRVEGGV